MGLKVIRGRFFAVTLQQHKLLGNTFSTHILEIFNENAGIYKNCENLTPLNTEKWSSLIPQQGYELIKLVEQVGEKHLFKVIGKSKGSVSSFFNDVSKDESLRNYLTNYVEQRLSKIFDILISSEIPAFVKEKNFNNIYHDNLLELYPDNAVPVFSFERTPNELLYSLSASCLGEKIDLLSKNSEIISNNPCIIRLNKKVLRFNDIDAKKLIPFFTKPHISIPKQTEHKYFGSFVLSTIKNHIVEAKGFSIIDLMPERHAVLSLEETIDGSYVFILKFIYGSKSYLSHSEHQREVFLEMVGQEYVFNRFERDAQWEKQVIGLCEELKINNVHNSVFVPEYINNPNETIDKYSIVHWANTNHRILTEKGIKIEQRVGKINFYVNGFDLTLETKTSNDWFDIHGTIKLKDFEIPFISLRKNIMQGNRAFTLPNGELFVLPAEWFIKYKDIFLYGSAEQEKIRLKKYHFGLVEHVNNGNEKDTEISKRFREITNKSSVAIPHGLNADLRDYQKQGLLWLQILHHNDLNGCLADDMGLGKTIQALAILLFSKQAYSEKKESEEQVNGNSTSLIVVPTSLIFNWQKEISRFAPTLSVYLYTGINRTKNATMLGAFDIVITTYGVIRNDIELIKNFEFDYVVFDESQSIKNSLSKTYKAVLQLNSKQFLSLTGTPIENSLSDLWSQMNLINRGMLNSLSAFTAEYLKPIENKNDEDRILKLKEMVEPFILRRTKEQVAKELPDLTEQTIFCDLTEEQQKIYDIEKSSIRNYILENIEKQGYNKSNFLILRALTKLRQLANHPRMVDQNYPFESGKFNEIARSIEAVVSEGHKILIFSSFVKHLKIIENYLLTQGIGYQVLTGITTNREGVVKEFQHNSEVKVFLISIKAGGVGLNLTEADYIFVIDPWWNPAVENQAIARAHRIGQDKKVFVYRFISAGTVEEKIVNLQERKALLADRFVNQSNPLSIISKEQVIEMIS